MAYRHLLVLSDRGAEADAAVRGASQIANRDRARLTIAAVAEIERPSGCQMQISSWGKAPARRTNCPVLRPR